MSEMNEWYEKVQKLKTKRELAKLAVEEGITLNRQMLRSGSFASDEDEIKACRDLAHFLQARKLFQEMEG